MASFTDSIPQFNPYVQQLPVDAMVQVGMQKQKQYDEGIQKIQTNIDNIAGLDVATDADKAYLQSKLNQLGSDLKTVAAGDFSNFQLVNSVNGMTNQIVKDRNVRNAVASTAQLRKQQARKEQAIKEGKSSPENEWMFNSEVNGYLQSTKPGESFSGQYIEYKDVDKKLRELASKLKETDTSIDNPFLRDSLGRTLYYDKKGNSSTNPLAGEPMLDMVMLNTKVKGVAAERILNNFYDSLDEGDKRQLNITAQYHYKDATPITFQNDIIKTYNEKKRIYSDAIVDASVKLAIGNLTPEEQTKLQNGVNEAKKLLYDGGLDKQMNEDMAAVDTEAEANSYKYKIYTQKYLTNLARDISNESISTEYKSNPGFQAMMEKKRFEFDVAKERQREREWQAKHILALKDDARKDAEANANAEKIKPIVKDGVIETNFDQLTLVNLDNELTTVEKDITSSNLKLGELIVPGGSREEKLKAANDLYIEYKTNPNTIDNNVQRELLQELDGLNNVYNSKSKIYNTAKKAGDEIAKDITNVLSKQPGLKVGNTSFSAEELYDFERAAVGGYSYDVASYGSAGGSSFTMGTGNTSTSYVTKMKDELLSKYKNTKYEYIAKALYDKYNNPNKVSPNEKIILDVIQKNKINVSKTIGDIKNKKRMTEAQVINDLSPEFQVKDIVFNKDNTKDMSTIEQIVGMKLAQYNQSGALDNTNPGDFNPETLAEIQKDTNASFKFRKRNDGSGELILTSGTVTQKIPLTYQETSSWLTDYAYVNPISSIKYSVQSSKNKTTNEEDIIEASTAGITGFSPLLPNINNTKIAPKVRVDVEGSQNNNGGPSDRFQVRLYYKTNEGWQNKVLNSGGYVNEAGLQELLFAIGPKTIDTLFK